MMLMIALTVQSVAGSLGPARADDPQTEWRNLKIRCGLPYGLALETWRTQGEPCPNLQRRQSNAVNNSGSGGTPAQEYESPEEKSFKAAVAAAKREADALAQRQADAAAALQRATANAAQEQAAGASAAQAKFIQDRDAAARTLRLGGGSSSNTGTDSLRGLNTDSGIRGLNSNYAVRDLSTAKPSLRASDAVTIRRQIAGIQASLRQLNKALSLDASQRKEWDEESAHATQDALIMAGSITLEGLGHATDAAIANTDKEIDEAVRLHRKRSDLRAGKAYLEQLGAKIDKAQHVWDAAELAKTIHTEGTLESLWSGADALGLIPSVAHYGKAAVEAAYLTAVQAESALRIKQINSNQDQYLVAEKVLRCRMEALVKASNNQIATRC
jgi:hypothetical protein